MKIVAKFFVVFFFLLVTTLFFYKFFLFGHLPFPGDLLIAEYNPWKTYSYLGYNPGSFPNKAQYFDVLRQLYPWRSLATELIKTQQFPLWNPYNFSGSPLFANSQSAVLYPLSIVYYLLPQATAWSLLVVLQFFLSGIFMYMYTRELNFRKVPALFSSMAFSGSLFVSVFIEYNSVVHALLWLPLALFAIEKILKKPAWHTIALLAFSITCSFLAGHLQIAGLVFFYTLCYSVFRTTRLKTKKPLMLVGIILFIGVGIAGIQFIPTLELINNSARVAQEYVFLTQKLLIQPYQLILFFIPDLFGNPATRNYLISETYPTKAIYIGLLPFLFALFSLTHFKKNNTVRFFVLGSSIVLLFLLRTPFTEFFYRLNIPLFSTSSPSNAIFLLSFNLSVLAGFGMEIFIKSTKKTSIYIFLSTLGIVVISLLVFRIVHQPVSLNNAFFSIALLGISFLVLGALHINKLSKQVCVIVFLLFTVFDLFYFFQKFNPFVPKQFVYPQTNSAMWLNKNAGLNRVWGYGSAALEANTETQMHLYSPNGYDPLYPKRYGEFLASSKDGKILKHFTNQTRSDAVIAPGSLERDLLDNKSRLKILDMLGVMYILDKKENGSTEKTFPQERFDLVYSEDSWKVFKNKNAVPRFFLTTNYQVTKSVQDFEQVFFAKDFNPQTTILLEQKPILDYSLQKDITKAKLTMVSYKSTRIELKTRALGNNLLFLSDTYYPGWKAFVDKKETPIQRADYAFRAIEVPKGEHVIKFIYQPESFSLGLKTTIISIALLITLIFLQRKFYHEK